MAENIAPNKTLCAVCGLFCPACTVYIATQEDPERLKAMAARFGMPPEELACDGCRSSRLGFFCRTRCKPIKCAAGKGLDFCGSCDEYPCEELKDFQSKMPHRKELWNSQQRIKEAGWEKWFEEMTELYSCSCGAINSAYDIKCRKCGAEPSCKYVSAYNDDIIKNMSEKLKT